MEKTIYLPMTIIIDKEGYKMPKIENKPEKSEIDDTVESFLSKSDLAKAIIWEAYFHKTNGEKFYANKFREKYGGSYGSIWPQFENLLGNWLICNVSPRGYKSGKTWNMKENRYLSFKSHLEEWEKKYSSELIASLHPEILHFAYLLFKKMAERPMTINELKNVLVDDFNLTASDCALTRTVEVILRLFHDSIRVGFSGRKGGTFHYGVDREKLPIIASNEWRCKHFLNDGGVVNPNFFVDLRTNTPIHPLSGRENRIEAKLRHLGLKTKLITPETFLNFPWVLIRNGNAAEKFPKICGACKGNRSAASSKIICNISVSIEGELVPSKFSEHAGERVSKFESCSRGVMALKNRIKEMTRRNDTMIFWKCPKSKQSFEIDLRMFIPTIFQSNMMSHKKLY
jgi:hypothetical protein